MAMLDQNQPSRPKRVPISDLVEKIQKKGKKTQQPLPIKQVLSWLLLVLAMFVCIYGGYSAYQHFKQNQFRLIKVEGLSPTEQQILQKHLLPVAFGGYFSTDLTQVRDHALQLTWVENVVVSRAWPDMLVVRASQRQPIARWGTGRLLSDSGVVFTPAQIKDYQHLPLLYSKQPEQARALMLQYHDISQMFKDLGLNVKELSITERMTWFIQFDNGLRVIVDQNQTMLKLQRLKHLLQTDLKRVSSRISGIDLRYRNGVAIQWKNQHTPQIEHGKIVF